MRAPALLGVLCALGAALAEPAGRPLVQLGVGALRGTIQRSLEGREVAAFRGVPYARPPVGELRFRPPLPHPGWSGVRDAARHGSPCLQFNFLRENALQGSEDCLFVNVYSPRLPRADDEPGLPVMVWVHGGGFISGNGDDELYGADYLLDEDVLLVTFNYRLGAFGFLTTEDAAAPGNYGLLDQVQALRWVREHIVRFGGDPARVTIFGESAGAASVSLLVLSPLAAGLFHAAISQSGAAAACWSLAGDQRSLLRYYAERLGCPPEAGAAVRCLRSAPAEDLMKARAARGLKNTGLWEEFHPRVDGDAAQPLLPDQPNVLLERGDFNRVPWVIGVTRDDGAFAYGFVHKDSEVLPRAERGDLDAWTSRLLFCGEGLTPDVTEKPLEVAAKVRDFALSGGDTTTGMIKFLGDRFFFVPMSMEVRLAAQYVPVYQYIVDHVGPGQMWFSDLLRVDAPPLPLVSHADDLAYLFRAAAQPRPAPGSPEHHMIRLFVELWTSFARRGHPAAAAAPAWPIYTAEARRHLRLNAAPSVGARAFDERVRFWEGLPLREPWNAHRRAARPPRDEL